MIAQHIYRWGERLQAGRSTLPCPIPFCRENICDRDFTFCHILAGTGYYEDAEGRRFRFSPGSLLLRLPGVVHRQLHDPGTYMDQFLVLPREFAVMLLQRNLCSPERPVIECGLRPGITEQFDRLIPVLEEAAEDRLLPVAAEMFRVCCELLLSCSTRDSRYLAVMAGAERLLADQSVPVPRVAREYGLSYSTFRRLFSEFLGCSPNEYRIRKRLEQIQSLLRTTNLSQKELAARFGYADVYTFHRQFRRHTGMTPGEFRNRGCGKVK